MCAQQLVILACVIIDVMYIVRCPSANATCFDKNDALCVLNVLPDVLCEVRYLQ